MVPTVRLVLHVLYPTLKYYHILPFLRDEHICGGGYAYGGVGNFLDRVRRSAQAFINKREFI